MGEVIMVSGGVWGESGDDGKNRGWIKIDEVEGGIALRPTNATIVMSPGQARSLAGQLYRLARRLEKRKA